MSDQGQEVGAAAYVRPSVLHFKDLLGTNSLYSTRNTDYYSSKNDKISPKLSSNPERMT